MLNISYNPTVICYNKILHIKSLIPPPISETHSLEHIDHPHSFKTRPQETIRTHLELKSEFGFQITLKMKLVNVYGILSFAAVSLALPTVEVVERTEPSAECTQAGGFLSCCQQVQNADPGKGTIGGGGSSLGGLLGILDLAGLLALFPQSTTQVGIGCGGVGVPTVPVNVCPQSNVCCLSPTSAQATGSQPLISLLSGSSINICPVV